MQNTRKCNQGHIDVLFDQCKKCAYMRMISLRIDGDSWYSCGAYPLIYNIEECKKFFDVDKLIDPFEIKFKGNESKVLRK